MLGRAFRFHTPSSILIVGPSDCGKTVFTEKLVLDNNELFDHNASVPVHYCYGAWQDRLQNMKDRGVHFHEGIPDHSALERWFFRRRGGILVLDDLMGEGSNDKRVLDLFTKHSHHQNVTVLYLCQDMFPVGKYAKSISRNAHYIVAFKNPRDQLGVRNVLLQSFPTTWKDSLETFHRATTRRYGYLVMDLHPASPDYQRLLSHLLKDEGWTRYYQKPPTDPKRRRRMICPERQRRRRRRRSRRLRRRPPPLFWECFQKIAARHLWTKMDANCMDWGPMHIVYKLIRKKKYSWITRYVSWYNETAFSELIWTLERQAWQMMMDPDVLHNL